MPKQQVMSRTGGHDEYAFEKSDVVSLAEAERRFKELTGKGFVAWAPGPNGAPGRLLKAFDPDVDAVFQPQLQGG